MTDAAALKVPPSSVEAEQSVLGALLVDNEAWEAVGPRLSPADFYTADHALIYRAVAQLLEAQKPADVVTVYQALQAQGKADAVGGLAYINELAQAVLTARNVSAYVAIVRQCAMRRAVIVLGQSLAGAAYTGGASDAELPAVMDRAAQALADLAAGRQQAGPKLMADLLPAWIDDLNKRAEGVTDAIGLGLRGLNRVLAGGARRGDLIVIGARPSMGKSALTLGMVRAVAAHHPVLVCTLEDSNNMLISRHVASAGRTPLEHVRLPQHAPESMWTAVTEAIETLQRLPIYLEDGAGLSLSEVMQAAKDVKRRAGGLGLVVVDYLQLMDDEGETRSNELANITRGLKTMAKRLGCVVLLLSQLSREADKTNAPPRLDHLAESGAIEQAADVIGLLWRESRRNPKPDNAHKAQIEFAKNKNGACDTVQLWFDGKTQRFGDMSDEGAD